jgi:putative membrane protein
MYRARWIAVGVSALALAACGHKDETTTTETTTNTVVAENMAMPATSPSQDFVNAAASSDAYEIATSRLAATQAQSPATKKFAAEMIKAHTESTAKLKTAAAAAATPVMPDATLTAEQQQSLDSLKLLKGADFDKAYASAQVDAHQKTLAGLKLYSTTGDVPSLKEFATKLLPTVAAHLNMANGLKP